MSTPEDPREAKLPLWAQDALEAARTKAALCWPSAPDPEPIWREGGPASFSSTFGIAGRRVFSVRGSGLDLGVHKDVTAAYGLLAPRSGNGFSHRPSGKYYATEREALVACQWQIARAAASHLRRLQLQAEAADAARATL
jgi:hypothetical protein